VQGGGSVRCNRLAVGNSWVACVGHPAVVWKLLRAFGHEGVAVGFCQDASCGDGGKLPVALDMARVADGVGGEAVAVNQKVSRWAGFAARSAEPVDGPMHGQERGVQYVDLVDLLRASPTHSPSDSRALNFHTELLAGAWRQFLGVVQSQSQCGRRRNHSGRSDRPSQATAACFVYARFKSAVNVKIEQFWTGWHQLKYQVIERSMLSHKAREVRSHVKARARVLPAAANSSRTCGLFSR
jgi:hypothetical protein